MRTFLNPAYKDDTNSGMKPQKILEENRPYTFSDYAKLAYPTRDVVAEFGYQFRFEKLDLPGKQVENLNLDRLRSTFYRKLPRISLNSEVAKREFLISPLLLELLEYVEMDIDVEYPLHVGDRLKGNIDYILRSQTQLVVIEAKNDEMDKGFTQLAVELIAIDRALEERAIDPLYGAVTTGDLWRFGILQRQEKTILKNIDAFPVPNDLETLFSVLLGILS